MKWFDRILLVLVMLCMLAVSVALIGIALGVLNQPVEQLYSVMTNGLWVNSLILIVIGAVLVVKMFFKTKVGVRVWDTAALKLPKIGDMVMKSTVARFTRTFGTLLASGVPILEALTITRGTINNSLISDALLRVHDRVRDGENLSTPLDQQKIFPTMVTSMVEVGEETGQLPEMLNRIADNYDEEVDNSVGAITSVIEPIMIVFLALVVGTIVIALFLPIIQIIQNLTGG